MRGFGTPFSTKLKDKFASFLDNLLNTMRQWVKRFIEITMRDNTLEHYLMLVQQQNLDLNVKGIADQHLHSLKLKDVYVELDLILDPETRLTAKDVADAGVINTKAESGGIDILTLIEKNDPNHQKFVIVGRPGGGKTTILRHLALYYADNRDRLPIFLHLRDHGATIADNKNVMLEQLIRQQYEDDYGFEFPPNWLNNKLRRGQCIVMLDGLDEVVDEKQSRRDEENQYQDNVKLWIKKQIERAHDNVFIITTRPHGLRNSPIQGTIAYRVQQLNKKLIEKFILSLYRATKAFTYHTDPDPARADAEATAEAQDLYDKIIASPQIAKLAYNPLLLTMIATVHRDKNKSMPTDRYELYERIFEVLLGRRDLSKDLPIKMPFEDKQTVLQVLAYYLMNEHKQEIKRRDAIEQIKEVLHLTAPTIKPLDFIQDIIDHSGLLVENKSQIYAFAHPTFQEFLTAQYIKEADLENELYNHIYNRWWHETILLYSRANDATHLIEICIQPPFHAEAVLLAFDIEDTTLQVDTSVRQRLLDLLDNDPKIDKSFKQQIRRVHLIKRIDSLVEERKNLWIDRSLVTAREYQLFLDANPDVLPPLHWDDSRRWSELNATLPILGITRETANVFCKWLNDIKIAAGHFRLPTNEETPLNINNQAGYWTQDGFKSTQPLPALRSSIVENDLQQIISVDTTDIQEEANALLASCRQLLRDNQSKQLVISTKFVRHIKNMIKELTSLSAGVNVFKDADSISRLIESVRTLAPLVTHTDRLYKPFLDIEAALQKFVKYFKYPKLILDVILDESPPIYDPDTWQAYTECDLTELKTQLAAKRIALLVDIVNGLPESERLSETKILKLYRPVVVEQMNIYRQLVLFEMRLVGRFKPNEGILIVREILEEGESLM